MIDQCQKLFTLEGEHGSFDKITKEWKKIGSELPQKKQELASLRKEIESENSKRADLLSSYEVDEKTLAEYKQTRQSLLTMGLDITHLGDLANFLRELKQEKFDSKLVISKFNTLETTEEKKTALGKEIEDSEGKLGRLQRKIASAEEELKQKSDVLSEARALEDTGLTVAQAGQLRNSIVRIGSSHGIPPQKAWERFTKDVLNNYDRLLGLEPEVAAKEAAKKNLTSEIAELEEKKAKEILDLKEKIAALNRAYAGEMKEIHAYSALRQLGVTGKSLLKWEEIITSATLNPVVIESELKHLANLSKSKAALSVEISDLKKQEKSLKSSVTELETRKSELGSAIKSVRDAGVSNIQSISSEASRKLLKESQKVDDSLEKISNTAKAVSESAIDSISNQAKQSRELTSTEISKVANQSKETVESFSTDLKDSFRKSAARNQVSRDSVGGR